MTAASTYGVAAALIACETEGCGDELQGAGAGRGWVLVRIVGSGDPPRRYCSGSCAGRGIAHVELGNHREDRPPATVTPLPGAGGPGAATRARQARLDAIGASASDVRRWARQNGLECGDRGTPRAAVVDAFVEEMTR